MAAGAVSRGGYYCRLARTLLQSVVVYIGVIGQSSDQVVENGIGSILFISLSRICLLIHACCCFESAVHHDNSKEGKHLMSRFHFNSG